ncbi:hypothetical protein F4805DRAFT_310700 [Annulohypoxylon moriforme]|nr:hypothetical protein F4805DRAFT_310700 [Annulohypoxylon moriforme]
MSNSPYTTESSRWMAVQARDPSADGLFVYAVRTTKIYCRPVCKARRARRANVFFYDHYKDAEHAGFRSCKRCKPEARGGMPEEAAVTRVRSLVERKTWELAMEQDGYVQHKSDRTSHLAHEAQVSKWHFHRVFKEVTGMTPAEYMKDQRHIQADYPMFTDEIWGEAFKAAMIGDLTN